MINLYNAVSAFSFVFCVINRKIIASGIKVQYFGIQNSVFAISKIYATLGAPQKNLHWAPKTLASALQTKYTENSS